MVEIEKDPMIGEVREILDKLDVEAIFFDLDDTLIYTGEIFTKYMDEYATVVGSRIGVDADEVLAALQTINDEEYKRMGVNPKRWEATVHRLADRLGHGEEIKGNLDILMKIYTEVPRMRKGVKPMLEILKATGRKLCLVTHANVEWTNFKLDILGLWNYFDTVVIVDENGHKKAIDWNRGAETLGVDTKKCIFVGDSLSGDIRSGYELGARTIWLPSPWSVYREGEVPENTIVIDEIFDTLAALGKLR